VAQWLLGHQVTRKRIIERNGVHRDGTVGRPWGDAGANTTGEYTSAARRVETAQS
jgi:hypothetical protein